ncbi:MAG: hypothetical protein ACT452_00310 [Microthrixaceae bacterium]
MRFLQGPVVPRVTWLVLPLLMGGSLGTALDARSRPVAQTGSVLAWGVWAAILVAVLIPRTVSLTALRIAAPAALAAANWAALSGTRDLGDGLGVAWAAVTVVAAFAPSTGDVFVNGSSYGDERRMPLRAPGALLLGPIQMAWLVTVAVAVGVPMLLASRLWLAAGVSAAIGGPAAALSIRALHGLVRRWVVFVPAGLVLHDLHALVDPVLFPRATVRRLGPAGEDTIARDLTQGALGLALELELVEATEIAPRRRDRRVQVEPVDRLLLSPTRPGEVLREAARRRIAVG